MFRQTYHSMAAQIHPNEKLIENTKNRMCSEQAVHAGRRKWVPLGAAAVAVVLIVTVAVQANPRPQPTALNAAESVSMQRKSAKAVSKPEIETPLKDGAYMPVVKLANGELHFMDSTAPQTSRKFYFDPKTTHEEQWTQEQTVKYLGRDVRPAYLPAVFDKTKQTAGENDQFVVLNNDGTPAYDNIVYLYTGDPDDMNSPSLTVKASKGKLPLDCVLYRSKDQVESTIKGSKLLAGHETIAVDPSDSGSAAPRSGDLYYAEFLYKGIGYRVVSKYLPQEEFIKVLLSMFD